MLQLDFFQGDDMLIMKDEIRKVRESSDKVRKSLFAKNGEITKQVYDISERLEILERFICRGE